MGMLYWVPRNYGWYGNPNLAPCILCLGCMTGSCSLSTSRERTLQGNFIKPSSASDMAIRPQAQTPVYPRHILSKSKEYRGLNVENLLLQLSAPTQKQGAPSAAAVRAAKRRSGKQLWRRTFLCCVGRGNAICRSWRNQDVIARNPRPFDARFLNEVTVSGERVVPARSPRP